MSLQNYQWELGGVIFGAGCAVDHEADVTPPANSVRDQDQTLPNADGWSFGQDFLEPGIWQFKLFTDQQDEDGVHTALGDLAMVWRADAYRKLPGKATELRYGLNGRTRVIYGRPRRFEPTFGAEYVSGRIPITADFKAVSDLFFDDYEDSLPLMFRQPTSGGFTVPFTAPLQVSSSGILTGPFSFTVGGVLPTPIMADFTGPLDNTGILIDGVPFIQFQKSIPAGVTVTVDARSWVTSTYRSDGGGAAGLLSPRSRMPEMLLEPGEHTVTLLGSSPTGTYGSKLRWRSAYPSV